MHVRMMCFSLRYVRLCKRRPPPCGTGAAPAAPGRRRPAAPSGAGAREGAPRVRAVLLILPLNRISSSNNTNNTNNNNNNTVKVT